MGIQENHNQMLSDAWNAGHSAGIRSANHMLWQAITRLYGAENAETLCKQISEAVLHGQPAPEPEHNPNVLEFRRA